MESSPSERLDAARHTLAKIMNEMVTFTATVQQKHAELPACVEIPASAIAVWALDETTTELAAIEESRPTRRSLKRWDDDRWFINYRAAC